MHHSPHDAAGRPIRIGDTIGGTATNPYAATVVGLLTHVEDGVATLEVPTSAADPRPQLNEVWQIPLSRTFLVGHHLDGQLRPLGNHVAEMGPALFFVTEVVGETRTVTRIDHSAPLDQPDRVLCRALVAHALDVLDHQQRGTAPDDGPTIVYAASDKFSVWRVDHTTVDDDRERAMCRGLLHHALDLCDQPVPSRIDETGLITP